jgi:excisionase family DNA binding protein
VISLDYLALLGHNGVGGMFVSDHQEMLTVKEAAARLKLDPVTIRRWIKSKRIQAVSLGSDKAGYRIPVSELQRVLNPGASSDD